MKNTRWIFLTGLLMMTLLLKAQEWDDSGLLLLQDDLEQLSIETETNWEDELEELSQRLDEPINLNSATRQQLEQLPFLTDLQIENLQAYVYIHGQMQTIYELQLVEGMDKHTIELLRPFVCVKPVEKDSRYPSLRTLLKHGKHEVLTRFDIPFYTRQGYEDSYLGPPLYHSLRYSFRYGDYLQAGLTGEKDAGEPFMALHTTKGYDFYSYYLVLRRLGRLKVLALGNYRLSFGQGLVLSSGFRLGKSYSLAFADRRSTGIRKHGSTDEFNYFRGAAATLDLGKRWEASAFYSYRTLDGVVKDGVITSIQETGLHRTENEADKINRLSMQMMGGNVTYRHNGIQVGATGIYYFFDRPYEPNLRTYAKYNLRGNRFYNIGLDYAYRSGRFSWAGEVALGKHGFATLNRLGYRLKSDCRLLLVHRYYAHDYWAYFAQSFGEGSTPQNENGWYAAVEMTPWARWRFFSSVDLFSFPWWRYRISKPSQGTDCMAQASYTPREDLTMYANYRYKRKERDVTGTGGEVILPTHHHKARYRLTYTPGVWRFQTTVDYNHFHSRGCEPSMGYLFTQQAGCTLTGFPLAVSVQGSYFCTDDYDSRVYAYEKGLVYTFYTPSFSGRGFRYSAHLRCDFRQWLMVLVKIGQTIYQDRDEIGSGKDLIHSNKKTDMQVQVRMKF